MEKEKKRGFWSVGRLIIGIILLVLPLFLLFQSCAAGMYNVLEENSSDAGGTVGVVLAVFMVVAGIVAIVTRNSEAKAGPMVSAVMLLLGGILALFNSAVFADLMVWGIFSVVLGAVFIVCAVKSHKTKDEEEVK